MAPQSRPRLLSRGQPRHPENRAKGLTVVAPVSPTEVVRVWRSVVKDQPQAKAVKVCHDGAGKRPCNKGMTTVPQDEGIKVSTAMSSSKRVCPGR